MTGDAGGTRPAGGAESDASQSRAFVVLCTAPEAEATRLADLLVERRLAACVSLMGPFESRFHWEGRIDTAREVLLVAKTAADRFDVLRDTLAAEHPYDVPEILALPVEAGLPAYLQWITASTRRSPDPA